MSWYQQLKPILVELLGLSKDAIHMHVGFFTLILYLLISRQKINSWKVLIPGLVLSVLMEAMDFRDDYLYVGHFHFVSHLHDLINTNLIPFVIVILAKKNRIHLA